MKSIDSPCPACGFDVLREFYALDNVTVNSCLVVDTPAEAIAYPRGDLRIAVCDRCGFITNTAFDLKRLRYDHSYEETQTYSPAFERFQDALVREILDRYDLYGGTVVEIGCGKGTFLACLSETGDVRGIGIDPSSVHERLSGKAAKNVRFINEFYSEAHGALEADLICCRHTLEHIPDVVDLLKKVHASAATRGTPIFFELPETLRILRENAYWDIYYEHCSYFTPGSLARLFESNGFDVTNVRVDYEGQYLLLHARPTHYVGAGISRDLDRPDEVVAAAAAFERNVNRALENWREYFRAAEASGKKIAIWGSGSKCVAFLSSTGVTDGVDLQVTDINPYRHGKFIVGSGKEIVPPWLLVRHEPDEVIAMNPVYRNEISALISGMGIHCKVVTPEDALEVFA